MLTTKDPFKVPPETKQFEVLTELPEIKQPVSLVENPEPVTLTVNPAAAEMGLSTMDGLLAAEVKLDVVELDAV